MADKFKGTPYSLTGPCGDCPFRNDQPSYLRPERVVEIGTAILEGADFPCHKTIDYVEDEEGETEARVRARGRICAGAAATLNRQNATMQSQRILERIVRAPKEYADDLPVYDSVEEWVRAKNGTPTTTIDGEEIEYSHCGVVGPDCEDPAGYGYGVNVSRNLEEPTCPPDSACEACGESVCDSCWGEQDGLCIHCSDEEDEDDG